MNYVAFHMRNSPEIYGVALCSTNEENTRLLNFAQEANIKFTTGSVHTVDELMAHAKIHYRI